MLPESQKNKKCNVFQDDNSYEVLRVIESKEKREISIHRDENGKVIEVIFIETIESISTNTKKPQESTGIKATLIGSSVAIVTLIGVLSDLPSAIEFVSKILHLA